MMIVQHDVHSLIIIVIMIIGSQPRKGNCRDKEDVVYIVIDYHHHCIHVL